ncbi:Beta sliding clamp [Candidatus Entotheonellaceae bacterium PAL068K]
MVATDGHRLAHIERPVSVGRAPRSVIVPRKALIEVSRLASPPGPAADRDGSAWELTFLAAEQGDIRHLAFGKGRALLVTRLIEGQFPDYTAVVPETFTRHATVEHSRLLGALRRVSLLSDAKTRPVKIEFEHGRLTLASHTPEMGEAIEQIPAEYHSDPMVMGFNARYLIEALGAMDGEQIVFDLNDPLSPGLMRPLGDTQYFYVIMPMRV